MTDRVQLFRARWVIPVSGPPIREGEVLVDGRGRIAAVAPTGALQYPAEVLVHDLGASILLPGLVNTHAHPELAMFRGALEDLPFRDWILRLVAARRAAVRDEDSLAAARWATAESLANGITTIAATETSGVAARALTEVGMRGVVFQEVFGPDPNQAATSLEGLVADLERLRSTAGDRVRLGVSPHAPYTVSDTLYREVARLARAENLPMAVHIAESAAEHDLVVRGGGDFAAGLRARGIETPARADSPIQLLARLGVLDARPLLIHCVDLDDADVQTVASSGCAIAHCPVANAKLGHGVAPIAALMRAGVTVGLGTDSVASNNRLDLLEEARVAALIHRAQSRDPSLLSATELLELCTIQGARALGLEDRIGTLEPGKEADLCAVGLDGPALAPIHDPVTALFHAARGSDVVMTAVAGEVLYRSGEYANLDHGALRAAIEEAAIRVGEAM